MKTHTIYRAEGPSIRYICGFKTGATDNFELRKTEYPVETSFEILEVIEGMSNQFITEAEFRWADMLGCPRGQRYDFAIEKRKIGGIKGGKANKGLTKEMFPSKSNGGLNATQKYGGWFGITEEQNKEAGRKGGTKSTQLYGGWFGMTEEQQRKGASEGGKIGGKITGPINGLVQCIKEYICPRCGRTGKSMSFIGTHIKKGTKTCPLKEIK